MFLNLLYCSFLRYIWMILILYVIMLVNSAIVYSNFSVRFSWFFWVSVKTFTNMNSFNFRFSNLHDWNCVLLYICIYCSPGVMLDFTEYFLIKYKEAKFHQGNIYTILFYWVFCVCFYQQTFEFYHIPF